MDQGDGVGRWQTDWHGVFLYFYYGLGHEGQDKCH